ncbi:MAG: efflux RND transporter periplasmic adaptor subunit [Xanthobacteraceae bacterium]|uniref:efflux RND transporter periplasmic adaptor subunit n=1 Tax=Pseudorhodoplanes sp. TaxID=1934341 RepID=UPI003D09E25E
MTNVTAVLRIMFVCMTAIAPIPSIRAAAQNAPAFEAVKPEVLVGRNIRIELKLAGIEPVPASRDVTVEKARLDMGPDGMEAMAAPLKPVPGASPGVLVYQADLAMAGRWAFSITARIKGREEPVASKVIFTAVEPETRADAPRKEGPRKILYYRNPMGLPDVSSVPKKDSMGMDYIPVYEDETGGPQGTVRISPEKVQRAGVRTQKAERRVVSRTVRAPGTVAADETRLGVVTAKFNGFVEELYVPSVGEPAKRGQKLMKVWIESPDILQKQADLTSTMTGAGRGGTVHESAERNLRFFGFSDEAVEEIRKAGRPLRSLTLNVPRDGIVLEKPAIVGMRFSSGDSLFRTADLSMVWVIAQVAEGDLASIREGQAVSVQLKAFANERLRGIVGRIYPELNMATRTVPVRIVLPNPDGRLRPGLFAEIAFENDGSDAVVAIPETAVIDSGRRRVAFVTRGEGLFEPRELEIGARGDGFVEIRKGVDEGEDVVVRGTFLVDAESNLKAALAGFAPAENGK